MSPGDWIGLASLATTLLTGSIAVIRFIINNAIKPLAQKVAEHDVQLGQAVDLSNSTNIKVARIEGYMAGQGSSKLPAVTPTVEVPEEGKIVEFPVTPSPVAPPPDAPTTIQKGAS